MTRCYSSKPSLSLILWLLNALPIIAQTNRTIPALTSSITFVKHSSFLKTHYFCRIHGACRVGEGTIILPAWMKAHSGHLSYCGFSNISYSITKTTSSQTPTQNALWKSVNPDMELDDRYRDQDLLGGPTPSAKRHNVASVITPLIHLIDMFSRPSAYFSQTSSLCVSEAGKIPCSQGDLSTPTSASLNPVLLIDSRITKTKDFLWPKSLLRLLRSSLAGNFQTDDLRDVYSWKVRTKACCFRSVVSTNVKVAEMPSGAISPGNLLFTENGLVRTSATQALQHAVARCLVRVLILNRYGQRFIEGTELLSSAISAFSNVLAQKAPHVQIRPEVVFFENSSFHEQVSVVQEAGVIVATHGESNANFMFARPDTSIFEILPFGYLSDDYKDLSIPYGVKYQRVTAQPDRQVFKACVRHFNSKSTTKREMFLDGWDVYARAFRSGTIEHGRNILSSYVVPEYLGDLSDPSNLVKKIRECAAYQRVTVDVRDLARSVVVSAARQCPIHIDLTMLEM